MIIAKQMDIRSNIKKFFDIAYEGEPVIVPRKQDRNVVIISEKEYNRLSRAARLEAYARSYSDTKRGRTDSPETIRLHNHEKINSIRSLKENWNGNNAPAIPSELTGRVDMLIDDLIIQPEIFPTALGTIQLEYDNSRRDHMEIEIDGSEVAEVFIVSFNGEESYESIAVDPDEINMRVGEFYG